MARARDSAGAVAAATRRRRLLRARLAPPRSPARPFLPPPPRGLPRPRCAAGPVTLAQRPPRSILRSWPPLASCFSRSVRQQSARPGQAKRRGDPTGSASRRACVRARRRRRSGFGGAGAASAPFPEVSARLPGELSLARGAGGPALCQRHARGAGCQGTGGHASPPPGHGPQRCRLLPLWSLRSGCWARPLRGRRRGRAVPGDPGIRGRRRPSVWPRWPFPPSEDAARRDGTGSAEAGFPEEMVQPLAYARELSGASAPGCLFSRRNFLIMWTETRPCHFLFCCCFDCDCI